MTKKESKEVRINSILEAAISEFIEKGYENTSMESIAARSGLTKGGLYYHFNSKDDILIKVNEYFMEPVYNIMTEALNTLKAADGISLYINKYLTHWSTHRRELSFVFLSFTKTLSNDKIKNMYNGYTSQYITFLTSLYQKGIENNEFIPFEIKSTACVLMSALDGIIGYIVLDKDITLEQTIDDFNKVFINQYIKK